jgi:hypothetical protein
LNFKIIQGEEVGGFEDFEGTHSFKALAIAAFYEH